MVYFLVCRPWGLVRMETNEVFSHESYSAAGAGDRFRVVRFDGGDVLVDRRGRVREWGSAAAAVRALRVAGRDLAEWELWWQPAGAIGWRVACLACDAGDVFAVR